MKLFQFLLGKAYRSGAPLTSSSLFSSHFHSSISEPASFGIAFDIDGVLLRGNTPIGGSPQALRRLYDDSGTLRIPFVFLTNGGGVPESKRALELNKSLDVNILPIQVIQGHSPFRNLVKRFKDELVVAVGKGEPDAVMSEYGFTKVLSMDEYVSYFENIDPLAQYKKWSNQQFRRAEHTESNDPLSERVQAVFVVSDPIDWSRDIQVLCDILRTGGRPGKEIADQPPIYFANDDLAYQALFQSERLGMGAFRIALESIFNMIHPKTLAYTSYGKPNPSVFKNAEITLSQICQLVATRNNSFKALYMIGDNPSVDINGAHQAGHPWFSILTRTGVFKGKENHTEYPADLVVDTVEEAVDFILKKEGVV